MNKTKLQFDVPIVSLTEGLKKEGFVPSLIEPSQSSLVLLLQTPDF